MTQMIQPNLIWILFQSKHHSFSRFIAPLNLVHSHVYRSLHHVLNKKYVLLLIVYYMLHMDLLYALQNIQSSYPF